MRSSARAISFHVSWLVSSSFTELAPTATDVFFVLWLASPDSNSSSSSAFMPLFSLLVTFVTGDVADTLPPLVRLPLQQVIPFKTEKKCHAWRKHEHTNSMALKDNGINTKRSIKTLRSSYCLVWLLFCKIWMQHIYWRAGYTYCSVRGIKVPCIYGEKELSG